MLTIQAGTFHLQLDLATLLLWAVVGIVAGFLASRAMLGHGLGLVGDLIVGIIGAYLGGIIAAFFGIRVIVSGLPLLGSILVAFVGALLLLLLLRLVGFGRKGRSAR
jgi:uncharacterized membrane protein YeaQ/YmgE (transglycosylase-associated protein family)